MTGKELLAICKGLKHFYIIIQRGNTQFRCDHKSLSFRGKIVHAKQRVLGRKFKISDDHGAETLRIDGDKSK